MIRAAQHLYQVVLFTICLLTCWGCSSPPASSGDRPDPKLHLYLLIGQSNMSGRGQLDAESKVENPRVLVLKRDLSWETATDPLHFDKPTMVGVGPGLAFGKAMADADAKVRIGLVPCAVGGTSIQVWRPEAEDPSTHTHPYSDMLLRVRAAQKSGVFKGVLWHQGETDLTMGEDYRQQLNELIERLRRDIGTDVPFVAAELSSFGPASAEATRQFNQVLQKSASPQKKIAVVSSEGFTDKGDKLHLDATSARELGRRYAKAMLALQQN